MSTVSRFALYTIATGNIRQINGGVTLEEMLEICGPGEAAVHAADGVQDNTHYVKNEEAHPYPESPYPGGQWDLASETWVDVRTLAKMKAGKNEQINAARLAANRSSFQFAGHPISCDVLSRSDIDAVSGIVALSGALPAGWVGGWKTIDNSYVAIPDVATWVAFYGAMVAQGQANFAHAQSLKATLDTAGSAAEIDAISVS